MLAIRVWIFLVLLLAGKRVFAQGDGRLPAVRLEPGTAAHWSMTVKQKEPEKEDEATRAGGEAEGEIAVDSGDAAKKAGVVRSEYVVTGETGRAVTKGGDGKRVEIYMFRHAKDTLLFAWSESAGRVVPYFLDQYVGPEMRFSRRYPGVDWVRASDYRGEIEFRGRKCHHFSMAPNVPDPKELAARADALAYDPRAASSTREAWFDMETGLPVEFRDGTSEGSYRHYETPREAVKLPEAYAVALRYYYGAGARPDSLAESPVTAPDPPEEEIVEEGEKPEGSE